MIKHFLATALIVSASATAFAQTPTPADETRPSEQTQQQPSNQFNSRDYTQMQSSEVPASLRTTLKGDMYKGWEQGTLYRQKNGNGYYLTTGSGAGARNYYFDKNGKAMSGKAGAGNSNNDTDDNSSNESSTKPDGTTKPAEGSGSGGGAEKP